MISILSLWLPILLSAIGVFLISSIIHMVLTYHRSNVTGVPDEDKFRESIGPMKIAPGDYMVPHVASPKDMSSPEMLKKLDDGPVISLTVMPNGPFPMGKNLFFWFVYSLIVGVFSAYLAAQVLTPASDFQTVLQLISSSAFMGYGLALIQDSIWWSRKWSTTIKFLFDALVYAIITGLIFAWLWPAA